MIVPVRYIENGFIENENGNYFVIFEVEPINYFLRSYIERQAIIQDFEQVLKKVPCRQQIFTQGVKTDLDDYLEKLIRNLNREQNENCQKMLLAQINYVKQVMQRESVSVKYYQIIEFSKELVDSSKIDFPYIMRRLHETANNINRYYEKNGLIIKNMFNNYTANEEVEKFFFALLNRRKSEEGQRKRNYPKKQEVVPYELPKEDTEENELSKRFKSKKKNLPKWVLILLVIFFAILSGYYLVTAFSAFDRMTKHKNELITPQKTEIVTERKIEGVTKTIPETKQEKIPSTAETTTKPTMTQTEPTTIETTPTRTTTEGTGQIEEIEP